MTRSLPATVAAVCTTFLSAVPEGLVSGLYLHGGLAFGEWVEGKSDVDFTATLAYYPERFHRVLRESLAIREGEFEAQYDDVRERGRDVGELASYVVAEGVNLR